MLVQVKFGFNYKPKRSLTDMKLRFILGLSPVTLIHFNKRQVCFANPLRIALK